MNRSIRQRNFRWMAIFYGFSMLMFFTSISFAGETAGTAVRRHFDDSLKGKTIAFVPVTFGIPLTAAWKNAIETEAKALGMKFVVRDPNMDPAAMTQAISSLIAERPDVLVVHNPNVQLLAKLLKKAEKAGIYVIQINMASNYRGSAYVGADWYKMGQQIAEDICRECGQGSGKSGKVALVQGPTTSAPSLEQVQGAMSVFKKHPEIKIVSNQAANWDGKQAHDVTAIVLKQYPDLCATYGMWGVMQLGAGQALRESGLLDKVLVYASGGGNQIICDNIEAGIIDKYWNYNAPLQGHDIMAAAKMLLQSGLKPGKLKMALFSQAKLVDRENANGACWSLPAK